MKTFKQFINQDIPVFCNAGGREGQYDKFSYTMYDDPDAKEFTAFCHSCGPPQQQQKEDFINENLNPRNNPIVVNSSESILTDPEKDNRGLGEEKNRPENFLPDYHGTGHVSSNFTNEQASNARMLSNNTHDEHEDYHRIITPYTSNSYNLNNTLHSHYIRGTPHPRIIKSHLDYDDSDEEDGSEIDTEKLDRLISSHKLPGPMTVYTGMHFHPNEHQGRIHNNGPYMSTSISPHVAKDFGKWHEMHQIHNDEYKPTKVKNILRLHLPKGHEHLFTDNGSLFPGQGELILPRNTRFQYGQRPTHIIRGSFGSHFGRGKSEPAEYHFYTGRILPRK